MFTFVSESVLAKHKSADILQIKQLYAYVKTKYRFFTFNTPLHICSNYNDSKRSNPDNEYSILMAKEQHQNQRYIEKTVERAIFNVARSMIESFINDLPIEILEIIFSLLPSVVDQTNLCLVCQHWRLIVLGLRHFHRKQSQLAWTPSGYEKSRRQSYTFDRYVYIRLPVAGSLNDWGKYVILNIKNLIRFKQFPKVHV